MLAFISAPQTLQNLPAKRYPPWHGV